MSKSSQDTAASAVAVHSEETKIDMHCCHMLSFKRNPKLSISTFYIVFRILLTSHRQLGVSFIKISGPDVPKLRIECEAVKTGRALVDGLLEERIQVQPCTRPAQVTVEIYNARTTFTAEDILSAPTSIGWDDETVPLTIDQRTGWVMRWDDEERVVYLRELLHAARNQVDDGHKL
ncbi:uncharacterized protein PHACADRAFT_33753 [Phanerochaete carnosa HHB-10118-sp]|uniref:Uncharacterized protein n=1 Tax=Phanerochaete carnosa (strain HHB-10118-sp) TaxID=650164 RepID=K5UH06_PHACS|nr:uncharacterized protein PHACADRAFT_33753 [Phanerochaete carnosa HHB-10118-sp]EKM48766.1 hypothetical protein PHACADRAFT_33753 [Phanerochaete carnosa HHB-10118-sp]